VLSLLMLAVIAAAAAVIYMMSAFRPGANIPNRPQQTASLPARTLPSHAILPLSTARPAPLPVTASCTVMIVPGNCGAWALQPASP